MGRRFWVVARFVLPATYSAVATVSTFGALRTVLGGFLVVAAVFVLLLAGVRCPYDVRLLDQGRLTLVRGGHVHRVVGSVCRVSEDGAEDEGKDDEQEFHGSFLLGALIQLLLEFSILYTFCQVYIPKKCI